MSKGTVRLPASVITGGRAGAARIREQIAAAARELADETPTPLDATMRALAGAMALPANLVARQWHDTNYARSGTPAIADRTQKTSPAAAGDFSTPEQTMTVRAKFKVTSTTQREHWDKQKGHIHEIELQPVIGGSPENESFYAATPGGMVKLQTVSDEAGQQFELGAEYYVDFMPADDGKRED